MELRIGRALKKAVKMSDFKTLNIRFFFFHGPQNEEIIIKNSAQRAEK